MSDVRGVIITSSHAFNAITAGWQSMGVNRGVIIMPGSAVNVSSADEAIGHSFSCLKTSTLWWSPT